MPRVTRDFLTLAPAPMGPRIPIKPINDEVLRKWITPRAKERAKRELAQPLIYKGMIFKNFKIFNNFGPADLIITKVKGNAIYYREHGSRRDSTEWVTTPRQITEWVNGVHPFAG